MNDPGSIKQRYRQFAETEYRGYSEAYYRLALAVADAHDVIGFLAAMPVIHPNLFFASIQFLTGPGGMPATAAALRGLLTERGGDVAAVCAWWRSSGYEASEGKKREESFSEGARIYQGLPGG